MCPRPGRDVRVFRREFTRRAAKHLVASLDKFKVPEKEKGEVLTFVTSLKKDIVEK